jgi:hypothetical protein
VSTPQRSAELAVRLATTVLPRGPVRQRYRHELVAELYYVEKSHQLSYAAGVVSHSWALRRAVTRENAMETKQAEFTAPLHCRVHLYHHYRLTSAEDGHRYLRCKDCGKDYPGTGNGPLDGWGAAPGPA